MKDMKKFLVILAIFLIILFGGAFYVVEKAAEIMSYVISQKTGTPVHIDQIYFKKDAIRIVDLKIGSPSESKLKTAFKAGNIVIHAPISNYFNDPIVFNRILIEKIYLGIEFYNQDRTRGNWVTLMNRLGADDQDSKKGSYSIIRELILRDLQIELLLAGSKPNYLSPVNEIRLTNIRSDDGRIAEELTKIIIQKMMEQVFILKGIKTIIDLPGNVLDTTQGLFETFMLPFGGGSKKQSQSN